VTDTDASSIIFAILFLKLLLFILVGVFLKLAKKSFKTSSNQKIIAEN